MKFVPVTITAEVIAHADGRPIAYIDATGIAVFAFQDFDGTFIIDIRTRDLSGERARVLLDGCCLGSANVQAAGCSLAGHGPEFGDDHAKSRGLLLACGPSRPRG